MPWTFYISIAVTIGGSAISIVAAALLLGWRVRDWIASMEKSSEQGNRDLRTEIHAHHEDNLTRFAEINVRLARLGNGSTIRPH